MTTPRAIWKAYNGNLQWLPSRTIFLCRSGSMAYGTNIEGSDEDVTGVFMAPRQYVLGFKDTIEGVKNSFTDIDCSLFEFRTYAKLASDNNPNVIELLFTDPSDWLYVTPAWEQFLGVRDKFLSTNLKNRYCGYAVSQLKRIRSHRDWLLNPPKHKPTRAEFGLADGNSAIPKEHRESIEAAVQKQVESWRVDLACLNDTDRVDLLNKISDTLVDMKLSADEQYTAAARKLGIDDHAVGVLKNERTYRNASARWQQYCTWQKERNEKRSELEAKYGYDTKHGMHLVRLMRQARELLTEGVLRVKRPDAEELKAIRAGAWSFEKLEEWGMRQDVELEALKAASPLPKRPDLVYINDMVMSIVADYLDKDPS